MTARSALPALLAGLLALGGCARPQPPLSLTERDAIAACRERANAVYDRLNRGQFYTTQSNLAPNSSTGLVGDPTQVLSQRYAHDQMVRSCVRNTGGGSNAPAVPPAFSVPTSTGRAPAL